MTGRSEAGGRQSISLARVLMTASALVLAVLGLAGTFLPHEILALLDVPKGVILPLLVQMTGALCLGFAFLNWSTRTNLIGGIYGRPLVMGNLVHFLIAGLAMIRAASSGGVPGWLWLGAITYAVFAAGFAFLMYGHPAGAGSDS